MGRFAWSQVRFRPARTLALVLGVLVAATAFTVLTAASRTLQARTTGTVAAHFQPAYDILVRPKGARSAVERETGTVQPDFLSGVYGGITTAQWQQIERIPGVSVAAPIAMVGYADLSATMFGPVPAATLKGSGRQLYRISTSWVSDNGASRVTQPPGYLYVTPKALITGPVNGAAPTDVSNAGCELTRDSVLPPGADPFGLAAQSYTLCWSRVNGYDIPTGHSEAGYFIGWTIPVLVAAIDPDTEAKLDGLNKALVSGGYLAENDGRSGVTLPVLASSDSGMNEYAETTLRELGTPAATPTMDLSWAKAEETAPGRTVSIVRTTAQQAYHDMLTSGPTVRGSALGGSISGNPVDGYWSIGQVDYQRTRSGALTPRQVTNPSSVWFTDSAGGVPMDDEESQYRTVTSHVKAHTGQPAVGADFAIIKVAGVFDPSKIKSFDPLSQVPLGDYQPVDAAPASTASRQALHGSDLPPSQNLGGLVSEPVNLVTTLSALPALENTLYYGDVNTSDPISVIRVKVAGVTGPGADSRARISAVALQIAQRTGLEVDVVAGSSPSPVTIDLPAGTFGQPALTLTENWVKEGVALAILDAVDRQSVALFTLILVVCILFVANAATAAVRGRRRELGVLAAVGWRQSRLFTTVLGELAWIGLAAGLLAAALAGIIITAAAALLPAALLHRLPTATLLAEE